MARENNVQVHLKYPSSHGIDVCRHLASAAENAAAGHEGMEAATQEWKITRRTNARLVDC